MKKETSIWGCWHTNHEIIKVGLIVCLYNVTQMRFGNSNVYGRFFLRGFVLFVCFAGQRLFAYL